jgi:hypothetical protein
VPKARDDARALSRHPTRTRKENRPDERSDNDSVALLGLIVSIAGLILAAVAVGLAVGLAL